MTRTIARIATVLSAVLCGGLLASPAWAGTVSLPLRDAVASLPVAAENRTGYNRDLFPHWIDADGDGCNSRYEVLIAEAVTAPSVGSGCTLSGGRWYSYYDNAYWTNPSDLDIDHVVALAEAWDSGARTWTTSRRQAFANDLGDSRSLIAVTDDVNQAKGDKDPAEWLPQYQRCRYLGEWVAVKLRWRLTVDQAEKNALTSQAAGCSNVTITVTRAF
ncbi:HNH endonuclease family protein [Longispora albida]|uniref:HNH endonuclease family protein n=1 Tax=Longispora albida TaxID=203523 RepID=UPI0003777FA3|nr:HNH endonuclease family protein [Longispora albida]